ncbi:uncharacterized protein LOC108112101 [Drosophila eugracilis]|uniref:uncharacterized protein LOC108112101 n=1 Tax=Drosophila eugracilis TaxID=29029 RepID=UPI0007E63523|nr:uncharacterized protein LOC108112101 [Drosophila eugracilis]
MLALQLVLQFLFLSLVLGSAHFRYHRRYKYSPELISELKDFEKLIPTVTIDEIVAEHMITDSGFRKAAKFLRSSDFKRLQQRIESLPEVVDLINFVHLNDTILGKIQKHRYHHRNNNRVRRSVGNEIIGEQIILVLLEPIFEERQLSSFTSFVQEVLTHLPRDRFVALINEKRQKSSIFAKFYQALKSPEFKTKSEAAWNTTNVQSVVRELSGHAINAQELKTIGYEVISWGPAYPFNNGLEKQEYVGGKEDPPQSIADNNAGESNCSQALEIYIHDALAMAHDGQTKIRMDTSIEHVVINVGKQNWHFIHTHITQTLNRSSIAHQQAANVSIRPIGQDLRAAAEDHIVAMNRKHLFILVICFAGISLSMGFPHDELIKPDSDESDVSGIGFVTLDGTASDESDESGQGNASDDLIFLSRKKPIASNNSVDLSAFVALIPLQEVQSIAAQYYHNDAAFQKAYGFLASNDFADIKRKILHLPEVVEFVDYLGAHGLDVIKVMHSVAGVFKPSILDSTVVNESIKAATTEDGSSSTSEPQTGLHGMVERVLEILPQDQLYALFFDEFESNKQFAAFVDSISSPKFAKILSGLQNSLPLRNLLFVLHNNSIYVERIVESVKSYLSISSF